MTKPSKEVRKGLAEARAFIEKRGGWMQGEFDSGDKVCAIGAVQRLNNDIQRPVIEALIQALPECFLAGKDRPGSDEWAVIHYNDDPDRRKRDVVAFFKFAEQGRRRRHVRPPQRRAHDSLSGAGRHEERPASGTGP
jgi:hypothetical protein